MAYPFQQMNRKALIERIRSFGDSYEEKVYIVELSHPEKTSQDQNPPQSHLPYIPIESQESSN